MAPIFKIISQTGTTPGRRQSETLSTIDERGSKRIEQCFRLPFVTSGATNDNRKHCFYDFYLRSSIVLAFSIAAYPVCGTATSAAYPATMAFKVTGPYVIEHLWDEA